MEIKTREELAREAREATDEVLRARISYYRLHVGAKTSRPPGVMEQFKLALAVFEFELLNRRDSGRP